MNIAELPYANNVRLFSIAIMFFSTKTLSSVRLYILILLVPKSIPNALFAKVNYSFHIGVSFLLTDQSAFLKAEIFIIPDNNMIQ